MKRGLALVEKGKTSEALSIAQKLHSIRYSGAFEVEAQALAREGSKEEAISVLQQGLEVAPASWLNGNLLGNYLSDLARYEEAFAAYQDALRLPAADCILIEANFALALLRAGRDDEARAKIAGILANDLSKVEPETQEFVQSVCADLKP